MRAAVVHRLLLALVVLPPASAIGAQSHVATEPAPPAGNAAGNAAVREAATLQVAAFLRRWREAWQASELARHRVPLSGSSLPGYGGDVRLQRLHCHGDYGVQGMEIRSASRVRYCPGWTPQKHDTIPGDERRDADAALLPAQRDTVRRLRARLLEGLATLAASTTDPATNAWLLGQRVRFTLDARDTAAARALVRQCAPGDAWCMLLAAHVEHETGSPAIAEPRYAAALAAMPVEERCRWGDIEPLLDGRGSARERFRALPCERRLEEARRFWWLADPLWSDAGNERWAEDVARRVTVALRSAVEQDDRMHWNPDHGGDALAAMVIRYGWPAYFWWGGEAEDASHLDWTQRVEQRWSVAPEPVFWSAEYPQGRLQLTPDAAQWSAPFAEGAWSPAGMVAPAGRERRWKPREHWAPAPSATPFAALADVQVALLPRTAGTLVVAATDPALVVGRRLLVPAGDPIVAALVQATGPDSVVVLAERRVHAAGRVVVAGLAPASARRTPAATIAALELRAAPDSRGVAPRAPRRRARAAVVLPPSLATLAAGARAISAPVLLEASDGDTDADTTDVLPRRMLGGTSLGERTRVTLYWETYGFAAGDSLEVTVRVTRLDRGAFARLAGALRLPGFRSEGKDAAAVTWREAPARGDSTGADSSGATAVPRVAPRVATRAWLRTIDLRTLPAGRYEVEVAVARPGEVPVTARRRFTRGK